MALLKLILSSTVFRPRCLCMLTDVFVLYKSIVASTHPLVVLEYVCGFFPACKCSCVICLIYIYIYFNPLGVCNFLALFSNFWSPRSTCSQKKLLVCSFLRLFCNNSKINLNRPWHLKTLGWRAEVCSKVFFFHTLAQVYCHNTMLLCLCLMNSPSIHLYSAYKVSRHCFNAK